MGVEIAAMIIAICCVVITGFLIPLILQIKRSASKMDAMADEVNRQLPVIMSDFRDVSNNARETTEQVKRSTVRATGLLEALGDFGDSIGCLAGGFRNKTGAIGPAIAGVVAGLVTLFKATKKDRED